MMTGSRLGLSVSFIGLGQMGSAMAANIAHAGFPLRVYNRSRAKAERLITLLPSCSVEVCSTLAQASAADVIVSMLADDDAVNAIYHGPDGVVAHLRPGTVVVDMSTVGYGTERWLARTVENVGAHFVDAPVSGSVGFARDRQLTILIGGEDGPVHRVLPVLQALGSRLFRIGPCGSGAAMKLAINTIVYGLNEALCEGLLLAERAGIERTVAYDAIMNSVVGAPFVQYRQALFEVPERAAPAMPISMAEKDMRLIEQFAAEVDAPLPQGKINRNVLRAAIEGDFGAEDVALIAEFLRRGGERSL